MIIALSFMGGLTLLLWCSQVKAAEEAGALATLIYSDPGDDGPMTEENGEKPYPEGLWFST